MHTDYKKINSFEVAVVGMIAVGFILIGVILFTSLTPRQQAHVSQALDLFDLHQQAATTIDNVQFIMGIPDEFYKQFYIAFTQVATVPVESFELPIQIVSDFSSTVSMAINGFTDKTVQIAYAGKVSGAVRDLSQTQPEGCGSAHVVAQALYIPYEYSPPNLDQIKLTLSKYLH